MYRLDWAKTYYSAPPEVVDQSQSYSSVRKIPPSWIRWPITIKFEQLQRPTVVVQGVSNYKVHINFSYKQSSAQCSQKPTYPNAFSLLFNSHQCQHGSRYKDEGFIGPGMIIHCCVWSPSMDYPDLFLYLDLATSGSQPNLQRWEQFSIWTDLLINLLLVIKCYQLYGKVTGLQNGAVWSLPYFLPDTVIFSHRYISLLPSLPYLLLDWKMSTD